MKKTKKIAISLLTIFGVSSGTMIPLIILNSTKPKIQNEDIVNSTKRYYLNQWINKENKSSELLSYFFKKQQILNDELIILENNVNKIEIYNFFLKNLFLICKVNENENKLNLRIKYTFKNLKECLLEINWHFINKKTNLILKNIKYYDILKIYFL